VVVVDHDVLLGVRNGWDALKDGVLTGLADAILAWFNDGGNVYLYCAHGVSRASHIDIAIHCRALGIGADDALARIKAQRPIADRTQVFWPNSNGRCGRNTVIRRDVPTS
jgi:hypothetical protein